MKLNHFCTLISYFLIAMALISCGPEQLSADNEREQFDRTTEKNIQLKQKELEPAVGTYIGKIFFNRTKKEELMVLDLKISTQLVSSPSRNELTEIPTLSAVLTTYIGSEINNEKVDYTINFPQGNYSPKSGKLILSTGSTSANVIQLEADLIGQELKGYFSTQHVNRAADFEVTKQ